VAEKGLFDVTQVVTYGSPTMGDPVPGVQYDLYEAQWDPVPLLSRYENPVLPSSFSQLGSHPWAYELGPSFPDKNPVLPSSAEVSTVGGALEYMGIKLSPDFSSDKKKA